MKKTILIAAFAMILLVASGLVLSAERLSINSKPVTEAIEDELYKYDVDVNIPANIIRGEINDPLLAGIVVPNNNTDLNETTEIVENESLNTTVNETIETPELPVNNTNITIIEEPPVQQPLKISFKLLEAPEEMNIDEKTGLITWTPTNEDALPEQNEHKVVVEAYDNTGRKDEQSFTITVENVNDAPEIQELPAIALSKERPFVLDLKEYVTDIDTPIEELMIEVVGQEKISINITEEDIANFSITNYWYGMDCAVLIVNDGELQDQAELSVKVEKTIPQPPIGEGMPEMILDGEVNIPGGMARLGTTQTQDIELVGGWNLFSLAVVPENTSIESVLSTIDGRYNVVETLVYTPQGLEWKVYVPDWPMGENALEYLDETMGIYIEMAEASTLRVFGQEIVSTTMELDKGWNLIGFPSMTNQDIVLATENIEPRLIAIFEYEPMLAQPWKYYNPNVPPYVSNLHTLKEGYGYWIHVSSRMLVGYENSIYTVEEVDITQEPGEYVYISAGSNRLIKIAKVTDEEFYYHYDRFGNTRLVTNEAGEATWTEDYYPFGDQLRSNGTNNSFGFGAKEYDYDTKLSYFEARHYNRELGRFMQIDPLYKPEKSPYAFGANNPFRFIDPSGMQEQEPGDIPEDAEYVKPPWEEDIAVVVAGWDRPTRLESDWIQKIIEKLTDEGYIVYDFYPYTGGGFLGKGKDMKALLGTYSGTGADIIDGRLREQGFFSIINHADIVYAHSGGVLVASKYAPASADIYAINGAPTHQGDNGEAQYTNINFERTSGDGVSVLAGVVDPNSFYPWPSSTTINSEHGLTPSTIDRIDQKMRVEKSDNGEESELESRLGFNYYPYDPYSTETASQAIRFGLYFRGIDYPE